MRSAFAALALLLSVGSILPDVALAQTERPSSVEARDREARSLFEAGRIAHDDGRFEDALGYFKKAHELSGRAQLLYNIGSTAERLRQDDVALAAYERYLSELPNADNRSNVQARVEILRSAIAQRQQAANRTPSTTANNPEWVAPDTHATRPAEGSAPITSRWWFWAAVGTVVVAGGVTTALLLSGDSDKQGPLPGRDGIVIATLQGP